MRRLIGSNKVYRAFHGCNMTHSIAKVVFFGMGFLGRGAALAGLLMLAACSTSNIEDAAPSATGASTGPNMVGPNDTGTFPNLNIPAQQAAPQFTDEEAKAKLAALNADNASARNPTRASGAKDDSSSLNALARSHGKDTLKEIEGKCDPALDPTCK